MTHDADELAQRALLATRLVPPADVEPLAGARSLLPGALYSLRGCARRATLSRIIATHIIETDGVQVEWVPGMEDTGPSLLALAAAAERPLDHALTQARRELRELELDELERAIAIVLRSVSRVTASPDVVCDEVLSRLRGTRDLHVEAWSAAGDDDAPPLEIRLTARTVQLAACSLGPSVQWRLLDREDADAAPRRTWALPTVLFLPLINAATAFAHRG